MTIALILAAASLGGEPSFVDVVARDWSCPGADITSGNSIGGSRTRDPASDLWNAQLLTREPYGVVVKWYQEKVDAVTDIKEPHRSRGPGTSVGRGVNDRTTIEDSAVGPKKRPVSLRIISWRKGDQTMVIVISRANEEEWTHIDIVARGTLPQLPKENKPNP